MPLSVIFPVSLPGRHYRLRNFLSTWPSKQTSAFFVPSEYGIDTSTDSAAEYISFLQDKIETVKYLQAREEKFSWFAVISGGLFDWGLNILGFGGWNVAARTATIFNGGNISFEATTVCQAGRAVTLALRHPKLVQNQFIFVNSFTTTQNAVLESLERHIGAPFDVIPRTVEEL
ncbi:hypothetical protein CORC01_06591 [Colletotrichum orchidophilum]|uniref:Uncharacterized protein n=1 Tax=Colletotrichum orchidophilum TaxID=1209926 RepID=A0A1G4B9I4_9PEZI|nr:uncharacterized protein CORC01_06591 [Colletotrichum orchidophilum]OHE98077.1 hypothetical protein CORC01_06591 [Colletotrichum orchidophilum]